MNTILNYFSTAHFNAARHLSSLPAQQRAHHVHGHHFRARIMTPLPPLWADFRGGESEALTAALHTAIAPLDYTDLNQRLLEPSDVHLAQWIQTQLILPTTPHVGVVSTPMQGVELTAAGAIQLWRGAQLEAAHYLPHVPAGHPCGRLHGHRFGVLIQVRVASNDVTAQYAQSTAIETAWQELYAQLQHQCLNEVPGLVNPTSEQLCYWLWQQLQPELPLLDTVTVLETATAGCQYDGAQFAIWKDHRCESALQLIAAPATQSRRRVHGQSYLLRLHVCAPLDAVLGWTVDYGDIKTAFQPLYTQLDHHLLNELPQLADADVGHIAYWLHAQMHSLEWLTGIEIHHTPGSGAWLRWGHTAQQLMMLHSAWW